MAIDYGNGRVNIDQETGIRYGVISMNSLACEATSDFEPDYGEATCPKCGNAATNYAEIDGERCEGWEHCGGCHDYGCTDCEITFDACDAFSEQADGFSYDCDGYHAVNCLDNDVMLLKSPYYTKATFCSPCVPGAGSLESEGDDCHAYCFGHEWFENGKAPYRVYSVVDHSEVLPS